jgi:hypothetical protein
VTTGTHNLFQRLEFVTSASPPWRALSASTAFMLPMRTGAFGGAAGGASFSLDRRLAEVLEAGACNQVRENMSEKGRMPRKQSGDELMR